MQGGQSSDIADSGVWYMVWVALFPGSQFSQPPLFFLLKLFEKLHKHFFRVQSSLCHAVDLRLRKLWRRKQSQGSQATARLPPPSLEGALLEWRKRWKIVRVKPVKELLVSLGRGQSAMCHCRVMHVWGLAWSGLYCLFISISVLSLGRLGTFWSSS
jgi:hypothetical protein